MIEVSWAVGKLPIEPLIAETWADRAPTLSLAYDDLNTSILRLAHTRTSGYQQMGLPETLNVNRGFWYAVLGKFGGNRFGSADGESLVVFRLPRGIGVTIDLDARVLHAGRVVGRVFNDLAGTIG
jgi:hypothetical protein